tara:strand:- start:582 stop:794 length:213 start_codon:yes stop_codon:yes gene_type:complete
MTAPPLPYPLTLPRPTKDGNSVKLFSEMTEYNALFSISNDPIVGNTLGQHLGFRLGSKMGDIEVVLRRGR